MAGTGKFEFDSDSPEDSSFSGNCPNGRGNYLGPNLDRSGSFREGSEGRTFGSGSGNLKVNATAVADLPPWPHCLNLDPIMMGDQKYTRAGELRRALGISFGNLSEDNSFGAAHSKPPPMLAPDELKRFKASVLDQSVKARNRIKRLDDSLIKLSKYCDTFNPKRQQTSERSCGSNLMKVGTQSRRSSPDLGPQKLEERNRSMVMNKRARTPMGDMRTEGRSNGLPRQHIVVGKDKDAGKDCSFDLAEEKIRRLPGGEGWDKKMKRKRSVSSVFQRAVDGDGEHKRTTHARLGNDSVIQASESHGFRSGPSSGANGVNKIDGIVSTASPAARMTPKNESEKASLSRELIGMNKEKLSHRGNSKLNTREDTHLFSPSSVTKGKASRAHRTGSTAVGNSSPNFSRMSGTLEDWEQPLNVNKVHSLAGVNNRKRPLPAESSSPPMAQWVQRPQKISRNRRTNIVSPTSNHDEVHTSSEGCAPEFSGRNPGGINGPLPAKNTMSSPQQLKGKLESAPSPARLSESEENSAAESRQKDKIVGGCDIDERGLNGHQHASASGLFMKKSKLVAKEANGDGVRRQGRTGRGGRGSSFSRGGMSSSKEKLDPVAAKPLQNSRPGSEKSGSKSGRPPLKKHSDRKSFARLGAVPNSNSPDIIGKSNDDGEELVHAAQFACNASYNGCSSSFWKKMEPIFYLWPEDKSFLDEQLKLLEEPRPQLSEMTGHSDVVGSHVLQVGHSPPQSFVPGEINKFTVDIGLVESAKTVNIINQFQDHDSYCKELDSDKAPNSLTLYQRVISALIVDDELEGSEDNSFRSNAASSADRDDPFIVTDGVYCNGNATHSRLSSIQLPVHEGMEESNYSYAHEFGLTSSEACQSDANGPRVIGTNASVDPSFECEYGQMSAEERLLIELRSIGLCPEAVPAYQSEGEDESVSQDIARLRKELSQQAGKKKADLDRIHKVIGEVKQAEGRELEQHAMDRLTELAYRRLLATRGSTAVRIGISKVPRHVALAYIRKTLARCRKFEDGGKSCFTEPAIRDVLFAVPSNNAGAVAEQNMQTGSEQPGFHNGKSEKRQFDTCEILSNHLNHSFAKNGPVLNIGRKKEVLLDDVDGNGPVRSTSNPGSALLGGAKGKRSERESGAKGGRSSITNSKGERKTKSKPKQKAPQMSMHPVQPSRNAPSGLATIGDNRKREGLISPGNILDSSKECKDSMDVGNMPLHELDSIEDLGVANEFGGHQDLSSWLNFDEVDGLQDHDSMGLEIPMDDLSDLHMLM